MSFCPYECAEARDGRVETGTATRSAREAKVLRMPVLGVPPMLRKGNYAVKSVINPCTLPDNEGHPPVLPRPIVISLGLRDEIPNDCSLSSSDTLVLISSNSSSMSWSKSGPVEALYKPKGEAARCMAEFLASM